MNILLDKKHLEVTEDLLPCIISYPPKVGGSFFSIAFLADMFAGGSKILFLTAYHMATDEFLGLIERNVEQKVLQIRSEEDVSKIGEQQVIMIKSGEENLFLQVVDRITDMDERVVFVKNMEVFHSEVINRCLSLQKVILSGNLDGCELKQEIVKKQYASTILFAQPEVQLEYQVPKLAKYTGYLWSKEQEGLVSTQEK